ncbi:hypothetical protein M0R45_008388 [Rubus argutus]|uniref:Uncharacterized protein n=1 Tax=Rubus argutus TaxID=59490 RepID=A0AAW1Y1L0_RUBAR
MPCSLCPAITKLSSRSTQTATASIDHVQAIASSSPLPLKSAGDPSSNLPSPCYCHVYPVLKQPPINTGQEKNERDDEDGEEVEAKKTTGWSMAE